MKILGLKNIITKVKGSVSELKSRMEGKEERSSELEKRITDINQSEQQREKIDSKKY